MRQTATIMISGTANCVQMATVYVPGDVGIDIPAGATADDLDPRDYQLTEVASESIARATIYRPNSIGVDLPAGMSASELVPTDYHIVEIGGDLLSRPARTARGRPAPAPLRLVEDLEVL